MKNKFSIAMTLAVVLAMLVTSLALADQVTADADIIAANNQSSKNLGNVAPGAVVTAPVSFILECNGNKHVDNGQTVNLTFSLADSTVPGGSLSATAASIGAIPSSWPDDGSNCPTTPPTPIVDNGDSTVTITAPSVPATYTYVVAYTRNIAPPDITGGVTTATFTLTVVAPSDTTPPVVTVPSNITTEATGPSGAVVSFTASANDLVDGAITPTCSPASGSTFPLGTTLVTCSATDAAGNTGSGSFDVTVVDTTPPTIAPHANVGPIEATGPSGAVATYTSPTANDIVDGAVAVTCAPASGSTFPLGTTTVSCSATDAHSNTGSGSFDVTVVDTTPPSVTVPSNMTVQATGASGATVNFSASASDIVDGALTPTCVPASGSTFPIGTTTVTCSATDAAGNTGSASFSVTVALQLSGFYQPVDMGSNVWNTVKNGSTVPLKFEIFAGSTELTSTSYVQSLQAYQVACGTGGSEDAIETVSTGSTSLRYDATSGQFIFNWQTPKKPGTCYKVVMTTTGGSSLTAFFKLK